MERLNYLAKETVDVAFHIHNRLGPGLLESVYEKIMAHELTKRGFSVERQKAIPISYDEILFEDGFRADLLVDGHLIVELKSIEKVAPVHKKQLLTYLRLADKRLGLLINFGEGLIKDGIFRVANGI